MSYNIDSFKVLELENLIIPLQLLLDTFDSEEWEWEDKPILSFCVGEGGLRGYVEDNKYIVYDISIFGEGSGWDMDKLENILTHSTGKLTAFLAWEGGDDYSLLEVNDGEVSNESIDIIELIRKSRENGL